MRTKRMQNTWSVSRWGEVGLVLSVFYHLHGNNFSIYRPLCVHRKCRAELAKYRIGGKHQLRAAGEER
jgi:hypothetical protein